MAGASSQGELDWGFSQVFGERTPGEEVQDGACGRDRVESRRCGGFYATRWETRAPRERARSPETLATRAARVSRTGRRRRDATLAFPATTPRAAAARPPSNARPARRFRRPFPPPIARNADVRLSRACSSFPFASLFTKKKKTADIISAVEFDTSGEHLATGDRGGRVVLFERLRPTKFALEETRADLDREEDRSASSAALVASAGTAKHTTREPAEYRYLTEFQSHEPEFDYLKSLEIEEKINTLRWCHHSANTSRFLISTNDKTIKLWKVFEKQIQCVSDFNLDDAARANRRTGAGRVTAPATPPLSDANDVPTDGSTFGKPVTGAVLGAVVGSSKYANPDPASRRRAGDGDAPSQFSQRKLRVPSCVSTDVVFSARCRRQFGNAHAYHINSLSVNSDCETYISADDLRVNLWHLERGDAADAFTVVDIKPENMEDLTEVITSAEFHPSRCDLFAYSSSKGSIRLADMRTNALCASSAKTFDAPETPGSRSFFSEIIASVSDVKFTRDGGFLLSRDYLNMRLWDLRMENRPVATFEVHEHLRAKLCDLYESDAIFDKFQCCPGGDGAHVATGSYGNQFKSFDVATGASDAFEVTKDPQRLRRARQFSKTEKGFGNATSNSGSPRFGSSSPRLSRKRDDAEIAAAALGQSAAPSQPEFNTKILHMAWHPTERVVACAASNSLYIFNA